jgi:hypothetical protein
MSSPLSSVTASRASILTYLTRNLKVHCQNLRSFINSAQVRCKLSMRNGNQIGVLRMRVCRDMQEVLQLLTP